MEEEFDLEILAKESEGFSGAELEQVIISGLYDSFEANQSLSTEILLRNIHQTTPLSRTMKEDITGLRQWAEGRARRASLEVEPEVEIAKRHIELK